MTKTATALSSSQPLSIERRCRSALMVFLGIGRPRLNLALMHIKRRANSVRIYKLRELVSEFSFLL